MAKSTCVFCGESIGMFRESTIIVGKTSQICCTGCAKEVNGIGELELCRMALQRGYVQHREKIEARAQLLQRCIEERPKCLRCGGGMKFGKRITLDASPMRDHLFSATFDIVPMQCSDCGKMEFYAPEALQKNEVLAQLYNQDT